MKKPEDIFGGKKVLVFGLGVNGGGVGTVCLVAEAGAASIIVVDRKSEHELAQSLRQLNHLSQVEYVFGEERAEDFLSVDIVIKSPGIAWQHPLLVQAEAQGVSIYDDAGLFFLLCERPIYGVTGSKGKTTTAALLAHLLETGGREVVRVGISQTGVLSEISKLTYESVVVFELSSWRLSGLHRIKQSPKLAIITNLFPDHLNYYPSLFEYGEDKKAIFQYQSEQDTLILNHDNEWTKALTQEALSQVLLYGKKGGESLNAWYTDEALWLEESRMLVERNNVPLQGEHNALNMLAASVAAHALGIATDHIRTGLETFRPPIHRFELIREKDGIVFINDTAATIPDAVIRSLESCSGPVVLLAGGTDKNLPYEPLLEAIRRVKFAVLFEGDATERMVAILEAEGVSTFQVVGSMNEAVALAVEKAVAGDTVLLSPGMASFGMFRNEFDRGDQFRKCVLAL